MVDDFFVVAFDRADFFSGIDGPPSNLRCQLE
jgi:hypothetical protein